uniref:Uncharacterized protein n=1 Tax=Eutreptiella gymnastica TaxID=73025 RepID=A0A7S1NJG1_9EUGL|mmetsp:Transcript_39853/g.71382  ORF Transcript_39853/g.71382 Transcript_39853/m.71382 type:complete len:662 (+) Transcript_39853:69-2054(+)
MDRLVAENNAKFEETLQQAKEGQSVQLLLVASDRGFGDPPRGHEKLPTDKYFQQMLAEIDKYTAAAWTNKADNEHNLYTTLALLLKGLLKECLVSMDAAGRKGALEKCWLWFEEKKKALAQLKLGKAPRPPRRRADTSDMEKDDVSEAGTPVYQRRVYGAQPPAVVEVPEVSTFSFRRNRVQDRMDEPLGLNYMKQEEAGHRATFIGKKLKMYKKRNLQKSHDCRGRVTPPDAPKKETMAPHPPPKVIYRGDRDKQMETLQQQPVGINSTFLPSSSHQCCYPYPYQGSVKYTEEFDQALRSVHKIWMARRVQEAEEKLDMMAFKDTLSLWSFNQSRIEEEINRRAEAATMSSQTGKTCHTILRDPDAAKNTSNVFDLTEVETAVSFKGPFDTPMTAQRKAKSTPRTLDSEDPEDPDHPTPLRAGPTGASTLGSASPRVPRLPMLLSPRNGGKEISLSAYDNFDHTLENRNMRHMAPVIPLDSTQLITPDEGHAEIMARQGLIQTHPEALRATAQLNGPPVEASREQGTLVAPSMLLQVGRPPPTKQEAPSPTFEAKNEKKKGKDGKPLNPVDPFMVELCFPFLPVEQEVPSLLRQHQMQQVEACVEAFARDGRNMPVDLLEAGLFTPEDRPYVECVTDLPAPEMGLCRDFTKAKVGKKGKK